MKEINVSEIENAVRNLCIEANLNMPRDIVAAIKRAEKKEEDELPRKIMEDLSKNIITAKELAIPVCQDTGMAVIFVEIGQEVRIVGGSFKEAINSGVAKGYIEGKLRLSVVEDPLRRVNTNSNTPAIIHTEIVDGDSLKITVAPKGFGSENMSQLKMMTPSSSYEDIVSYVVQVAKEADGNPCPPIIVGVGIGGDFEMSAILAKKALLRSIDENNKDEFYCKMEQEILEKINNLKIGPQGFGGKTSCLGVSVETYPTHIAGLPVAVNIGCHVTRHVALVL